MGIRTKAKLILSDLSQQRSDVVRKDVIMMHTVLVQNLLKPLCCLLV